MSCDCSGCQRSKQIGTLRAKQPEQCRKFGNSGKYPSKSKKVAMDRYLAARKWLLLQIKWYKDSYEHPEKYGRWKQEKIKYNTWGVKKYKEARALVKALGLITVLLVLTGCASIITSDCARNERGTWTCVEK